MLEVIARGDSPESEAAQQLAEIIRSSDRAIEDAHNVNVKLVSSIICYGEKTQDIDLVLFLYDKRSQDKLIRCSNGLEIRSVCVTIEVKDHHFRDVRFEGPKCYVRYNDEWHSATDQSFGQMHSLRNYVNRHSRIRDRLFVSNLLWLRNVPNSEIPAQTGNIFGSDSTWEDIVNVIGNVVGTSRGSTHLGFSSSKLFDVVSEILTREYVPTSIDRRRMEAISKGILSKDTQYSERLGDQLLIFRGRGGTGKTVRLLRIAYQLYEELGYRVLLLTYNKALVADLTRLLALMKIRNSVAERSVKITSIYKFLYRWFVALGLWKPGQDGFLTEFDNLKESAVELIKGGALQRQDIQRAISDDSGNLRWDVVLIDESQDWFENERDILYTIYGHKKFVLADGIDQFVRRNIHTDWRFGLEKKETQVVPLTKSLRLKSDLCKAVKHFADELDFEEWKLDPVPEAYGGKIVIASGNPFNREFHAQVIREAEKDGNKPIDLLLCVPPSFTERYEGGKRSTAASWFSEWGYEVWDGVSEQEREGYPDSVEQLRIVQYDSCRGLEGWTSVLFGFDEFYDYKVKTYKETETEQATLDLSDEVPAIEFAKRWLLIPLTRAIDTLVIHVNDENSYVGSVLKALQEKYPDEIEWHKIN